MTIIIALFIGGAILGVLTMAFAVMGSRHDCEAGEAPRRFSCVCGDCMAEFGGVVNPSELVPCPNCHELQQPKYKDVPPFLRAALEQ